jgi:hypothetical protein
MLAIKPVDTIATISIKIFIFFSNYIKKRISVFANPFCLVDNSIEISNISFSPRNFELAIQSIQFIQSILYSIIFSTTS